MENSKKWVEKNARLKRPQFRDLWTGNQALKSLAMNGHKIAVYIRDFYSNHPAERKAIIQEEKCYRKSQNIKGGNEINDKFSVG